ncbi:MAG: hypothetical protein ACD_75C00404G0001 [uncultured bacterium]|nr:MAG: hypothetical protein ACD_75C00404G0001 [uncultured bacterium]
MLGNVLAQPETHCRRYGPARRLAFIDVGRELFEDGNEALVIPRGIFI